MGSNFAFQEIQRESGRDGQKQSGNMICEIESAGICGKENA